MPKIQSTSPLHTTGSLECKWPSFHVWHDTRQLSEFRSFFNFSKNAELLWRYFRSTWPSPKHPHGGRCQCHCRILHEADEQASLQSYPGYPARAGNAKNRWNVSTMILRVIGLLSPAVSSTSTLWASLQYRSPKIHHRHSLEKTCGFGAVGTVGHSLHLTPFYWGPLVHSCPFYRSCSTAQRLFRSRFELTSAAFLGKLLWSPWNRRKSLVPVGCRSFGCILVDWWILVDYRIGGSLIDHCLSVTNVCTSWQAIYSLGIILYYKQGL